MRLTHLDILEQCFHDKFRGYNKDEVDTFLHLVADDYKEMTEEIHELKAQLAEQERRLNQRETMSAEKKKGNETDKLSGAEDFIDLTPAIIKKRANSILSVAREQAENHIMKGQEELADLQRDIRKLREERESLMRNIKLRARSYIESLRNSGRPSPKNVSADQKM